MRYSRELTALLGVLALTGCQQLERGGTGDSVEMGTGRDEGSTPYALGRSSPFQRAGMANSNIAASRAEAAMDVSGSGTAELARRSAAATIDDGEGSASEREARTLRPEGFADTADDTLRERIYQALGSPDGGNPARKPLSIQSLHNLQLDVANGIVTLQGSIDSPQEVREIEELIRGVDGVKDIVNELESKPASTTQNP